MPETQKLKDDPNDSQEIPQEELAELKKTLASAEEAADKIRKSAKLSTEEKAKRLKETAQILRNDVAGAWLESLIDLYPSQKIQIQKTIKQVEAKANLYERQAEEILKGKAARQEMKPTANKPRSQISAPVQAKKSPVAKPLRPVIAKTPTATPAPTATPRPSKSVRPSPPPIVAPKSVVAQPQAPRESLPSDHDRLPKLNNNGHVSIVLTGGRSTKETSKGGGLFDSINQFLYDPKTNTLAIVEVSRDIKIKGTKLNTRTKNNPARLKEDVASLTKETVDYHANLTLESAEQLAEIILETFGPISVKQDDAVVCQMKRPDGLFYYFPKNPTITNAKELVKYAQFRYGWRVSENYQNDSKRHGHRPKGKEILARYSGNSHRQLRQSALVKGILEKLRSMNAIQLAVASTKIPKVLAVLKDSTNIPPEEIGKFLYMAKKLKDGGGIVRVTAKDKITAIWEESPETGEKKYKGEKLTSPDVYKKAIDEVFKPTVSKSSVSQTTAQPK